jgi:hypothetical protein
MHTDSSWIFHGVERAPLDVTIIYSEICGAEDFTGSVRKLKADNSAHGCQLIERHIYCAFKYISDFRIGC